MGLNAHGIDEGGDYDAGWQETALRTGGSQVVAAITGTQIIWGDAIVTEADAYATASALPDVADAIAAGAHSAVVQVEGADMRWLPTADPTAEVGFIIPANTNIVFPYSSALADLRLIGDGILTVRYEA